MLGVSLPEFAYLRLMDVKKGSMCVPPSHGSLGYGEHEVSMQRGPEIPILCLPLFFFNLRIAIDAIDKVPKLIKVFMRCCCSNW